MFDRLTLSCLCLVIKPCLYDVRLIVLDHIKSLEEADAKKLSSTLNSCSVRPSHPGRKLITAEVHTHRRMLHSKSSRYSNNVPGTYQKLSLLTYL